jgi:hypothetical protein
LENWYSIGKLFPDADVQAQADDPDQKVQDRGAPYSAEAIGRRRQPWTVGIPSCSLDKISITYSSLLTMRAC